MRSHTWPVLSLSLLALALSSTGCAVNAPVVGSENLGNASVAIAASYQSQDLDESHGGQVILVDSDGSVRSVRTAGIDNMRLAWTGSALAFSDQHRDYLLSGSLVSQPHGEPQLDQISLTALPSGKVRSVFNTGQGDEGPYEVTTTVFDATGSLSTVKTGVAPLGHTECGASSYIFGSSGVGGDADELRFEAIEGAAGATARFGFEPAIGPDELPCSDGTALAITVDSSGDDESTLEQVYLAAITVSTGKVKLLPLRSSDGTSVRLGFDDVGRGTIRPQVVDGAIEWVGAKSGRVYRTRLDSGQTSTIRDGMPSDVGNDACYTFGEDRLDVLSGVTGKDVTLTSYDLSDGWRETQRRLLPGVLEQAGDQVIRSVLVIPEVSA